MFEELVKRNRTYRRFHQDHAVTMETLRGLIDLTRYTASAANLQPLKYRLSCDPETNARIFPTLGWAGYLKEWPGPEEGERPSAYVVVLGDTGISRNFATDAGIAMQTILLGATEKGLGGCIVANIDRDALRDALPLTAPLDILCVLAVGRPKETVVVDPTSGDVKYWRDADGVHHVPKRPLKELILE